MLAQQAERAYPLGQGAQLTEAVLHGQLVEVLVESARCTSVEGRSVLSDAASSAVGAFSDPGTL